MGYDKSKALTIIHEVAEIFDKKLKDKEILILTKQGKSIVAYNMMFYSRHFKHFTGVDSPLSAVDFYERTIHKNLSVKDIEFKDSFLAEKKMRILQNAMNLPYSARMLGDFNYAGIKIQADVGSGNTKYTMAFRRAKNNSLYPVSILEEDIRKSTKATSPIVAILARNIGDKTYSDITYRSKNINFDNLTISKDLSDIISADVLQQLKPHSV